MSRICRFLFLLLLFSGIVACGPNPSGPTTGQSPTATPHPTRTATPAVTPTSIAIPIVPSCPGSLKQTLNCQTPQTLRTAYGIDPLIRQGYTGKGETIIDIVSFGSPTLQQDMQVFDHYFGLPPVDLEVISPLNVPEYDPKNDKAGWAVETTLDVELIHALAPEAKIIVLTSPVAETEGTVGLPQFRQLQHYVIDHHLGHIISQSWGASEVTLQDAAGQQELTQWNTLYQDATTRQHISILSASGDNGATDYADMDASTLATTPTTSFPADSPWVTSVGGTRLQEANKGFSEQAWSRSGGGFSRFYSTPLYQESVSSSAKNQLQGRRGVPDVAAVADPRTSMAIYVKGKWGMVGGTSASTPIWAAMIAIANQMAGRPLGFLNPALYKIATSDKYTQDFHDITLGDNSIGDVQGNSATVGWDAITGWGTPNAEKLLPDLIAQTS